MAAYDDYIWRLSSSAPQPVFTVDLPKDLQWIDELTWSRVQQNVEYSVEGSLLIQEGVKKKGRFITLVGADNMAWITRSQGLTLLGMRDTAGLIMNLKFVDVNNPSNILIDKNVMFRHSDGGIELANIKNFDQYESDAWFIVNSINLMETLGYGE